MSPPFPPPYRFHSPFPFALPAPPPSNPLPLEVGPLKYS